MKKFLIKAATLLVGSFMLCSGVSAASHSLQKTSITANADYKILMYTLPNCWACNESKAILEKEGFKYETVNVAGNDELREQLKEENAGWNWFPMIFINGTFFGTVYQLKALHEAEALQSLVHNTAK